ncbi:MAG: phenylacetate-coenzyme A ligase PaaK-like adenylate-forming protein [Patiriisocius sp.]|jgi:phenylacetate-coenzyme A ligase PaaK-like adenylate-forming protein
MILLENTKKLHSLLQSVRNNAHTNFYSSKYDVLPANFSGALTDIPLLTREELVTVHPADRCHVLEAEVDFVAYTSGTTSGKPLLTYLAEVENYHIDPTWGIDVHKALIVFPPLNKNFGGTFIQQCRQSPNPLVPVFADITNMATSAYLGAMTKCDALYATPSLALALAPYIAKQYDAGAIKLLVISGETIGTSKLATLQALYPKAHIANVYASSEIGQFIMGPTPAMIEDGVSGFRLLSEAVVAAELIEGELVVTYELNDAFPLVRYKTGDHFSVSEELTEKYGEGAPILQWGGKGGVDVVRMHGLEIRTGSVDDFFTSIPQDVEEYQLHIFQGNKEESVRCTLECVMRFESDPALDLIKEAFVCTFNISATKNVRDAMDAGIIESVEVVYVEALSHTANKRRVLVNHIT